MKTAVSGHVSAAKAPPVGRAVRGNRSSAVQVVAFRDTHRAHQLKDTACEFARELGHNTGRPWEELVDINVMTTMQEPRKHVKLMGIEAFEATLGKPARVSGGLCDIASCRVLLSAINDDTDTVFLLMGPEKPPAAGGAGDHTERVQYHLLKLDFMLDDTARRITSITHRATLHASPAPPLHHIKAAAHHVVDEVVAHKVAHAWCSAATSGQEPEKVIGPHLAHGFQLWDAYGMMAHMVNAPAGQQAKGSHSHGHSAGMPAAAATGLPETMSHQQAMDMLKAMQHWGGAGMATETRLLDYATALDRNAAFMHWICTAAPAATVSSGSQAKPLTICKPEAPAMLGEGMQVMLFNEDGQVTDVWMFADAMPTIPAKQHSS